jgi:hypothetical protein
MMAYHGAGHHPRQFADDGARKDLGACPHESAITDIGMTRYIGRWMDNWWERETEAAAGIREPAPGRGIANSDDGTFDAQAGKALAGRCHVAEHGQAQYLLAPQSTVVVSQGDDFVAAVFNHGV